MYKLYHARFKRTSFLNVSLTKILFSAMGHSYNKMFKVIYSEYFSLRFSYLIKSVDEIFEILLIPFEALSLETLVNRDFLALRKN